MPLTLYNVTSQYLPWAKDFYSPDMRFTYQGVLNDFARAVNDAVTFVQLSANGQKAAATSSSSVAIPATVGGSVSFTLNETDRVFTVGSPVFFVVRQSPASNRISGVITAYTPATGAITLTVTSRAGSGTYADWVCGLDPTGAGVSVNALQAGATQSGDYLQNINGLITGGPPPESVGADVYLNQLYGVF